MINPKMYTLFDSIQETKYGICKCKSNGKYKLLNEQGKSISPMEFDLVFALDEEGLFEAEVDRKWGIINNHGYEVIPFIYDRIEYANASASSKQRLFSVEINRKWGIIDVKGKEVIPTEYDDIQYNMRLRRIEARKGQHIKCFTDTGDAVDYFEEYEEIGDLGTGGIRAGRKGDKWRLINQLGEPVSDWLDTVNGLTNRRLIK
jgi:hypothetical protein